MKSFQNALRSTCSSSFHFQANSEKKQKQQSPSLDHPRSSLYVENSLQEIFGKKTSLFFLTRLKGALLKSIQNVNECCGFNDLIIAMKSLKGTFEEEGNYKQVRQTFKESNDSIEVSVLMRAAEFLGTNCQGESLLRFNTDVMKERSKKYKPSATGFQSSPQVNEEKNNKDTLQQMTQTEEKSELGNTKHRPFNTQMLIQLCQLDKQQEQLQNKRKRYIGDSRFHRRVQTEPDEIILPISNDISDLKDPEDQNNYLSFLENQPGLNDSLSSEQKVIKLPRPKNVRNGMEFRFSKKNNPDIIDCF